MEKIVEIYKLKNKYENMINDANMDKLQKYFEDNKREFIKKVLVSDYKTNNNFNNQAALVDILAVFIEKTLENENCKLSDVKILSPGIFSNVIKIGNKVVKCGLPRKTFNIPNDERILQPVVRVNVDELNVKNIPSTLKATIEISEAVDTDVNISREDLYQLYKEMRLRGIICADIKYNNVGVLLRDNEVYWNEGMTSKMNPGMQGNINKVLKKGEYVILDTDFIYNENDPNIHWGNTTAEEFEMQYQREFKATNNETNAKSVSTSRR